jgi:hypothetical protein
MIKLLITFFFFCILIVSCKIQPDSDRDYDKFDPDKTYKLQLNPATGSAYYYDITNESETKLEVDDKRVNNETKTTVGVNYTISRDSAGDFLFNTVYNKVHFYTKSGDIETDMDADNAAFSMNPAEKMLGILKDANIVATVSPSGEIKNVSGYKEMGDKIMAGFAANDINSKNIVQDQWEKLIGDGLIKKNMDQLFKIFPDSAVHLRDTWKLNSRQDGEIGLNVKTTYTLKAINSEIAIIGAKGKITSDNNATNEMGYGGVTTNLTGEQLGEFEMEAKTGMLIRCNIKINVEGTIEVMGREIPVIIKASNKIEGRKK